MGKYGYWHKNVCVILDGKLSQAVSDFYGHLLSSIPCVYWDTGMWYEHKLILILAQSRVRIKHYFVYLSIRGVMQDLVFPIIATGVLYAEEIPFLMVPDWWVYFVCVKHKHWQWFVVLKFAISYLLACKMNSSCSVGGAIGNEFSKICVKLISLMRNLLLCCSRFSFEVCL